MHRDLRWENVACTEGNSFLLDLELCGMPGEPSFGKLASWSDGILADGIHYTEASDVRALGKMLEELHVVVSADGLSCLEDMCNTELIPTAGQVLQHRWLHCKGISCKLA